MDAKVASWIEEHQASGTFSNASGNTKAAIIIEPRRAHMLIPIIRYTMNVLGHTWNLYVFVSEQNEKWVRESLSGWHISIRKIPAPTLTCIGYNFMLTRKAFWMNFAEEYLFMFHIDSVLLRRPPECVWKYGMVGSPSATGMISGRMSTRLRSCMLGILENIRPIPDMNEDVFFTYGLRYLYPSKSPTLTFCGQIFVEKLLMNLTLCGLDSASLPTTCVDLILSECCISKNYA